MKEKNTIIALDFSSKEAVLDFLRPFTEPVYVKIGMELFYAEGPSIVEAVKARGHQVFLDLKLHDIPNTVRGGMRNLAALGADIVNVHCAGGIQMMQAAVQGLTEGTPAGKDRPLCIGVTILTSLSQQMMNEEVGIPGEVLDQVVAYAKNAKAAGLDGVVCSVHEAAAVRQAVGEDFLIVTPGIRLATDSAGDQQRVATPAYARAQGSTHIVVGRSITGAADPKATYEYIQKEFEKAEVNQ